MKAVQSRFNGRKAIVLQNDLIRVSALLGGGRIAELRLLDSDVNPMWQPHWKSLEPGAKPLKQLPRTYGAKQEAALLASIAGHNVCLGHFGPPSDAEAAQGIQVHGEIGVTKWDLCFKQTTQRTATACYGCTLPESGLGYCRRIEVRGGEPVLYFQDAVQNLQNVDKTFTWTQHWTVGQPFVENGVTIFDCSGTRGHVFPEEFAPTQRLKTIRLDRGETQKRFAARLGVSVPTLRAMEQGDPGVRIGLWVEALWLLDRLDDLDCLLAVKNDLFEQRDMERKRQARQRAYAPRRRK